MSDPVVQLPQNTPLPDASGGAFTQFVPAQLLPYVQLARWDRPAGWQLLLLPCWWSSVLASDQRYHLPDLWHLILLLVGAIAMRGAGCTYNDLVDRELDGQVERTRNRPLPSGRISPQRAKIFLIAQALAGLAVLLCFNRFTVILGLSSLGIVAVYPFMKRVTSWPQIILGLAFAWGALVGWGAELDSLNLPAFFLYFAAIFWTVGYDTIYALQDTRDDAIVGIRSTARLFNSRVKPAVGIFYCVTLLLCALALVRVGVGAFAWLGWLAFAAHLFWQISRISPKDSSGALMLFRSNRDAGLLLFVGLVMDTLLRAA